MVSVSIGKGGLLRTHPCNVQLSMGSNQASGTCQALDHAAGFPGKQATKIHFSSCPHSTPYPDPLPVPEFIPNVFPCLAGAKYGMTKGLGMKCLARFRQKETTSWTVSGHSISHSLPIARSKVTAGGVPEGAFAPESSNAQSLAGREGWGLEVSLRRPKC